MLIVNHYLDNHIAIFVAFLDDVYVTQKDNHHCDLVAFQHNIYDERHLPMTGVPNSLCM